MNVLYVCADKGIPLQGHKGASVHVRAVTSALQRLGHDVTVAARRVDGDNPPPDVSRIVPLHADPGQAAAQLRDLIGGLHTDAVIERYSLDSGAARQATADRGMPLTLEVNAPLAEEARRYRGLNDPAATEREHRVLQAADRIQVVSGALLRYVRSVAPRVPSRWIPNGVDTLAFTHATPAYLPGVGSGPVVGFAGSMKPWHGVDVLLDAFASARRQVPGLHLLLVGGGPEEQRLRDRAAAADLAGTVTFTGQVSHHEVPPLVKRFDVAVAPYQQQTDFYFHPLKVVEYLAAGVPVIYADQGDLAQLVGRAGVAHQPGSVRELAERIVEVTSDQILLARLQAHTTERAAGRDWHAIATDVLAFASGQSCTHDRPGEAVSDSTGAAARPSPACGAGSA